MEGVTILMAVRDGEEFLPAQLDSIAGQSFKSWLLQISDDSQGFEAGRLLERFRSRHPGRVAITAGPRRGGAANFLALACRSDLSTKYFAFCDQDDVWGEGHLQRAVAWLSHVPENVPALYCSRTRLIDAENRFVGFSPLFRKAPAFGNALVQNIAGGNTMVFNSAARRLLLEAGQNVDVVVHDWWLYILVSGAGGVVHYSAEPSVSYRQHSKNLIGNHRTLTGSLCYAADVFCKRLYARRIDSNLRGLDAVRSFLTPEARRQLDVFVEARRKPLFSRMSGILQSRVYRQTFVGQLSLMVAAAFGRL